MVNPTIREQLEALEDEMLAPQAAHSRASKGRVRAEAPDPIRPMFQRDRDRVIHSKAFRRLKHKTQVFFAPEGDHYRTRLTHTLEVSQIARSIAKVLRLNEELTELHASTEASSRRLDEARAKPGALMRTVNRKTCQDHHRDRMTSQPFCNPPRCCRRFHAPHRQAVKTSHFAPLAADVRLGAVRLLIKQGVALQKLIKRRLAAIKGS
jgi:hypothetical protein